MEWWLWGILGMVLLAAEMVTAGLFLMFFGVGGIVVGILVRFHLIEAAWMQWLAFSVVSLGSMALFRKPLQHKLKINVRKDVDTMIGERAVAIQEIAAGGLGKVELRGSPWQAKNLGDSAVKSGQGCKVEKVDGITLLVRGE
jgi:membrane protein implicated in regulation of membrane protease activity